MRRKTMPVHDWTRVDPSVFAAFHHDWITEIARALNRGLLPNDFYALPEQQAAGIGPDILTLQTQRGNGPGTQPDVMGGTTVLIQTRPKTRFLAESDEEFYRRKKSSVVVRQVSGDRVVAFLEIVSPGNKSTRHAIRAFVDKACDLLEHRIHLLLVDPFPPGPRDPQGMHAVIWEQVKDEAFVLPTDKPLTLASYECDLTTRAYIEPIAVGEPLPSMPLFVAPEAHVLVPLEATYQTAFEGMPQRWKAVVEAPGASGN
jgi:hypothetical protein